MNALQDIITNMAETTPQPENYTGEDGLLYCGKCRTPKQRYFPEGKALLGIDRHPTECECQKAQRLECEAAEARRKHLDTVADLKRNCFSDKEMEKRSFANDNGKTPQMEYARRYVEHWEQMKAENIGYYLWGDTDSGKSYLAACIANALTEKEISVRMTNFPTILNDLGASFEGRNEYIERLCRFPLLIIDDLGTERGTEYALEHVYNVIDSRYRSGKPLILTANISPDVLHNPPDIAHARIYSRIIEMCVPIHVTGIQNRKQTAQRKMETLKNLMNDND
ncbi:MAG: ATP-binding protein [Ruminococcaceae bacterium]|nr:ATP-binding protein [Oscillospiraceae bacterium]